MPETGRFHQTSVAVDLGPRSYEVRVVSGAPDGLGNFAREALDRTWAGKSCRSALIVTDNHLADLPPFAVSHASMEAVGIKCHTAVVPAGEASKSIESAVSLYQRLIAIKADRHTVVVALGGGVVGDLAGFVAATYARGLPLLMIPTSLLAQVDSSVGGKVGVNLPTAKNMVGAFHQPVGVWIDTDSLETLPDRELRCGLAEVVKYGVILDAPFFDELEEASGRILDRDPESLRRIISRSCQLKAGVVCRDEREETGLRAVLNFGHTVGHAIEAVAGYGGALQHGEAVAVGMVAEARLARSIGWIGPEFVDRLLRVLEKFGLPTSIPEIDPDRLIDAMGQDKKNRDGKVRFVLPRALGMVELTNLPSLEDIRHVLAAGRV